jgi:hypothetical protein
MAKDDDRVLGLRSFGVLSATLSLMIEETSEAVSLAAAMPSRAIWVTGAALRGHVLYHGCVDR